MTRLFWFAPGNGISYRVLFGRLPAPTLLIPFSVVFGFAEGDDALVTGVFDTDRVGFQTFRRRWRTARHVQTQGDPAYLETAAYAVFQACTGGAIHPPADWQPDWLDQIPCGVRG